MFFVPGICYLWMGNFAKAQANMMSAVQLEGGLEKEQYEFYNNYFTFFRK